MDMNNIGRAAHIGRYDHIISLLEGKEVFHIGSMDTMASDRKYRFGDDIDAQLVHWTYYGSKADVLPSPT